MNYRTSSCNVSPLRWLGLVYHIPNEDQVCNRVLWFIFPHLPPKSFPSSGTKEQVKDLHRSLWGRRSIQAFAQETFWRVERWSLWWSPMLWDTFGCWSGPGVAWWNFTRDSRNCCQKSQPGGIPWLWKTMAPHLLSRPGSVRVIWLP